MPNIQEISRAIVAGTFTNDELNTIGDAIRFARSQIAKTNKSALRVGTQVKFTNNQRQQIIGTVEKVNRKFIMVREVGKLHGLWKVPANMLEAS